MFKKLVASLMFVGLFLSTNLMAAELIGRADALYEQGGRENYKQALDLCLQALESDPQNYEYLWKCARAHRYYAEYSKRDGVDDYKNVCKIYGKRGYEYAEQAMLVNPDGVEAPYYYSLNVGVYKDGAGIMTAIKEGLKDKTEMGFTTAYEKDKMYNDGSPIKALGRFYSVLPWPLQDNAKALKYLREYQQINPQDVEGQIYLAQVLIDTKKKDEARDLLLSAAKSDNQYFSSWADQLLQKI